MLEDCYIYIFTIRLCFFFQTSSAHKLIITCLHTGGGQYAIHCKIRQKVTLVKKMKDLGLGCCRMGWLPSHSIFLHFFLVWNEAKKTLLFA